MIRALQVVQLLIGQKDALRDIAPIEELPPAPSLWPVVVWPLLIAAGLALFLVGRKMYFRVRGRKRLGPHELAAHELERIRRLDPPSDRLHAMLSKVLRRFLSRHFGYAARQRTTQELRHDIDQIADLTDTQRQAVVAFLEHCDLVKFAHMPAGVSCAEHITWLTAFIEQTSR